MDLVRRKNDWRALYDLAAVVDDPKMFAKLMRTSSACWTRERRLNGENLPSGANS